MRSRVKMLLPGLLFALFLAGCGEKPDSEQAASAPPETAGVADTPAPASACKLRMGWDPWEPYQYRNARGDVTGLDVEIASAVAEQAGCDIEFVEGQWMTLLEQLRSGDISLLAGSTRTPGREEFATFTAPYRSESFVVYTLAENATLRGAVQLVDLVQTGSRVGTVAEYYYGPEVSKVLDGLYEGGRLKEAVLPELNYERLLNGEIDAFIDDPFVASAILRKRNLGDRIVSTGMRVEAEDVSFMLSRSGVSVENAGRFSAALETLRTSGALEEILARYRFEADGSES